MAKEQTRFVPEDREFTLDRLRAALIEGEQSGPTQPHDPEAFLRRMHLEHARRTQPK